MSEKDIQQSATKLQLDISAYSYVVAVIRIDDMKKAEKMFGAENRQLISFAVLNVSNEILNKYDNGVVFSDKHFQFTFIFMKKNKDAQNFKSHVAGILTEIIDNIKKFLGLELSAGLGDEYKDIESVRYSYNDALTAIEYRVLLGSEKVIIKSDIERKPSFVHQRTQEIIDELSYKIKLGTIDEIMDILDCLFDFLKESSVTISYFRTVLLEVAVTILKAFDDLDVESEGSFVLDFEIFEKILEFSKLEDIREYYKQLCRKLSEKIVKMRQEDWALQVKRARAFIDDNYGDKNLSIQMLCDYLYLSSSYFSKIFKDGTGQTFKEYLTGVRMKRAKELLKNTSLKTYEIADQVGYADPHYFSHSFKQNVGVTPKEYRGK